MFWLSSSERPYVKWERDNTTTVNIYFKEFVELDGLGSRAQLQGMHTHYSSQKNITHCPIKMEQSHNLYILQKCLGTMSLYNNKAGGSIVYIK